MKKDQLAGGKADKKNPKDFDQAQLKQGIKVEMEHTKNIAIAQEIAMDHLSEDPDYYKKLKEVHLEKSRESKLLPPEQRKSFRQALKQFQGEDVLAGQLTGVKGVSDRGIEARRADPKAKGLIAHGFARTGRSLEEQKKITLNYFKQILEAQKKMPKPMLKNEDNPMHLWAPFKDVSTKTVGWDHPVHGRVSIAKDKSGSFALSHNGKLISSFSNPTKAIQYMPKYINSYVRDSHPHGPSWQKSEISKTDLPATASTPTYRSPSPNSPQVNPVAAQQMQAGATWSVGQTMSNIADNFRSAIGYNKSEKSDKPFHGYNKNKHSKSGGLKDSYRKKINREEGSNLKRPVTGKVKAGSKAAKRRKSFCARMSGVKGPTSKDGKLTPKGAALKRWKCSKNELLKNNNYFRFQLEQLIKTDYPFKKPHFIFSAENPLSKPANQMTTEQAVEHLKQMGENPQVVRGKYGKPERSIFVHDPKNPEKLHEFASQLGQESAILSTGLKHQMHYYHGPNGGKIRQGEGTNFFEKEPEDLFTEIGLNNQPVFFSHNFDWDDQNLLDPTSVKKSSSNIRLYHLGMVPDLTEIDPAFMGTGLGQKGQESKYGRPEIERSYYYLEGTPSEDVVPGKHKYTAELQPHQKLYDIGLDKDGIHQKLLDESQNRQINPGAVSNDEYLKAVKDAGYYGYHNSTSDLPNAVALFYKHPVKEDLTQKNEFIKNFMELKKAKTKKTRTLRDLAPKAIKSRIQKLHERFLAAEGKSTKTNPEEGIAIIHWNKHGGNFSVIAKKNAIAGLNINPKIARSEDHVFPHHIEITGPYKIVSHQSGLHGDEGNPKTAIIARMKDIKMFHKDETPSVEGKVSAGLNIQGGHLTVEGAPVVEGTGLTLTSNRAPDSAQMTVSGEPRKVEKRFPKIHVHKATAKSEYNENKKAEQQKNKIEEVPSDWGWPSLDGSIKKSYRTDIINLLEDLKKSKNVRQQRAKVFGTTGEPDRKTKQGGKFHEKQAKALAALSEKRYGLKMELSGGKFRPLGEINKERTKQNQVPLTAKELKNHPDYETSKNGKLFRSKDQKKGVVKPDWRSGKLESQQNIGARVHELAHLEELPEGLGLPEAQIHMDVGSGEAASKYHGAGKQIEREIIPMSMENRLRRRAGIPAYGRPQYTNPEIGRSKEKLTEASPERISLDTKRKYGRRFKDPKTKEVYDLIAQSSNITPEMQRRMEEVDTKEKVYDPEKGWVEGQSVHAKMARKIRLGPKEYFKKLLEATKKKNVA